MKESVGKMKYKPPCMEVVGVGNAGLEARGSSCDRHGPKHHHHPNHPRKEGPLTPPWGANRGAPWASGRDHRP